MAATHAKHHDYHLVNPSPWPVLASIAASIMAIGAVIWMRSMGEGAGLFGVTGPWVFAVGFAGVVAAAFCWWRDVIREAHDGDHTPGRAAAPPLRHDPVHRLGGDVLRRLVLGLLRRRAVPGRACMTCSTAPTSSAGDAQPAARRPVAADPGRRHRRDHPGQRRPDARRVPAHLRSVGHPAASTR